MFNRLRKFHVHDFEIFDIWENMKEAELKTVIKTGKLEYLYAWKVVCYPSSVWFCKSRSTLSRRTFWKFSFSCKFHVSWIDGVLSYDMLVTTEGQYALSFLVIVAKNYFRRFWKAGILNAVVEAILCNFGKHCFYLEID